MKTTLLSVSLFFMSTILFSQQTYDHLHDAFSPASVEKVRQSGDIQALDYYTFLKEHSYHISEVSAKKLMPESMDQLPVLSIDADHFDVLSSGLVRSYDTRKVYRIKNTNKILVLYSIKETIDSFNDLK